MEFDAEFKFAKIRISHVEGGGGLVEFDAEFKFAKIQNSHVEGGSQNLMLSPNLLKSKIPMLRRGLRNLMLSSNLLKSKIHMLRGGGGLMEFDAESKFAKKKFAKNFLSFWTKIGTVLFWTLSTKWFPYTKYRRTTKIEV